MSRVRAIKSTVKPRAFVRHKLFCSACGGDDAIPNSVFRGDLVDGLLYLECEVCRADLPPYYTQEAVQAMLRDALDQAGTDE